MAWNTVDLDTGYRELEIELIAHRGTREDPAELERWPTWYLMERARGRALEPRVNDAWICR